MLFIHILCILAFDHIIQFITERDDPLGSPQGLSSRAAATLTILVISLILADVMRTGW